MTAKPALVLAAVLGGLGWLVFARLTGGEAERAKGGRGPAPVEVAPVAREAIELRRTLTGTLQARERFVVASHRAGRVQRVLVQLADAVEQGQVVAELDDDDEVQGVAEASAELAAARASLAEAESALQIAERELERLTGLEERGVVSPAELDLGRAQNLARRSAVKVAEARLQRIAATLERARIRSGYARVVAAWTGDARPRFVAQRHVDEGDTVAVGDPLVTIVALEPLDAVVHVTEKEYGLLRGGQPATITTDAYPDHTFSGTLERLAPVFSESSRQARAEIAIANEQQLLKPGMFVRAELLLAREESATVVPQSALVRRQDQTGVFIVDAEGKRVSWQPVKVGIRQGERVAVTGKDISGRVVTLGQQMLEDGSAVTIPEMAASSGATKP